MPQCENCGAHVSKTYVAVRFPDGVDDPPGCPACPDMVVHDGEAHPRRGQPTERGGSGRFAADGGES